MARWDVWPYPTDKPPFGAILNPDCALNRGKVGCWLFNEGAGGCACNMVDGKALHGKVGWSGQGVTFDGSTMSVQAPTVGLYDVGSNDFSVIVKYYSVNVQDTADYGRIVSAQADNGSPYAGWSLYHYYGYPTTSFNDGAGYGFSNELFPGREPLGYVWICLGLTVNRTTGILTKYQISPVGGNTLLSETKDISAMTGALSSNPPSTFSIGQRADASSAFLSGGVAYVKLHIGQVLSAAEVLALYREPYGLDQYWVPGIEIYYSIASAGIIFRRNQQLRTGSRSPMGVF